MRFVYHRQEEKVAKEVEWFKGRSTYERTYGWSWFLKLYHELKKSTINVDHGWSSTLKPLADLLVENYKAYLPNLVYPIRVGEHTNTAFGLIFPLEYAKSEDHDELRDLIKHNATELYRKDAGCPLTWEPSGYDFLSPCLQEAALMGDIMENSEDFEKWLRQFLPSMLTETFDLKPGEVIDRTDPKLVHLDGLNFSRAWSLYSIVLNLDDAIDDRIRYAIICYCLFGKFDRLIPLRFVYKQFLPVAIKERQLTSSPGKLNHLCRKIIESFSRLL